MPVTIEEFKPLRKNNLLGFARVRMPSGVIFHDVSIHNSSGSWWAAPASKTQINRDGVCLRGKENKIFIRPDRRLRVEGAAQQVQRRGNRVDAARASRSVRRMSDAPLGWLP